MFRKHDDEEEEHYGPAQHYIDNASSRPTTKTYLLRILLVVGTLTQWFLLVKLWVGKPLPEILGEINGLAPPYGAKPTLFQKEPHFNALNSSDPRWTNLLPKLGGGFVKVPNWEQYTLPEPVVAPSDGRESYNIAVFHQLHCLHSIAGLVEELLASPDAASQLRVSRKRHIEHCFEYLRLALRCCGDTTLEGQGKTVEAPGIDGFGSWHMCRDIESISEWSVEHRASDLRELPT